jgi:cupin fold WbuC family metalloprotein
MGSLSPVEFLFSSAVDEVLLARLAAMPFSASGTRRICLHESEASRLHAMVVESLEGSSFYSHYHSDSDEVIIVIRGQLEILIWDNGADSLPTYLMLGVEAGDIKIVIVRKDTTHTTKAIGGNCVYLEVKLGPFRKDALVQVEPAVLAGARVK